MKMRPRRLGVLRPPSVFQGGQRLLASERGITLFEVSLLLVVTMALVAALAPTLSATLGDARAARATTDMNGIRDAINNFKADTFTRFTRDGTQALGSTMFFLYSDGDIPEVGLSPDWTTPADSTPPTVGAYDQGFLEDHLVANLFNGASYLAGPPTWRGAYINAPIDPDPWGNRYGVNVVFMSFTVNDVVVHSAGPDEEADTAAIGDGLGPADDDIIVLVEA